MHNLNPRGDLNQLCILAVWTSSGWPLLGTHMYMYMLWHTLTICCCSESQCGPHTRPFQLPFLISCIQGYMCQNFFVLQGMGASLGMVLHGHMYLCTHAHTYLYLIHELACNVASYVYCMIKWVHGSISQTEGE